MAGTRMTVGVVGAGAMGGGIAQVAAAAGHHVVLGDVQPAAVGRARAAIAKSLARDVAKGRLAQELADAALARISDAGDLAVGYAAYADCGIVIEAVLEDLAVKRTLFAALEGVVRDDCILATNTSSLSVAALSGGCAIPGRVLGVHFFNPAPVMPLVEIVPAITTAPAVADAARALVDSWKKTTVVATDTPGFIVNRIARPFYGESLRILEEGIADAPTIDWALRELGGFRMGPFELMDFIGNDVNYAVTTSVFEAFFHDPRYRPSLTQRRLVEAGLYGRKRGRGFYDYAEGAPAPAPHRDGALGQRVVDRVLAMLVNEAVDALYMRVASAADLETSMTRGVSYPRGLLAWGDAIGAPEILRRLETLQAEYGDDRYRPTVLLRRRVRDGQPLLSAPSTSTSPSAHE
ncbi:MAG: 3-hydroxyacyl-CoA dehydrogenase NAD-binding protein [Gemmatimonadetes bacterium]|jgi:3-hydroxybutyryl-CoA dehydrogenase|nr:3-hydroxyacyl-CoA dehydrogenase NAD-binding protein [Gemmatimonadota bacterium]